MLECWLAGVLDFNGHIGVRLGARQLQPYISVYSRRREPLEWLKEIEPNFSEPALISKNLFMSQIVSISGTKALLEKVEDDLMVLGEAAGLVLEFCNLRLAHPNEKYTIRELQLVREVIMLTSRKSTLKKRLRAIEKWL